MKMDLRSKRFKPASSDTTMDHADGNEEELKAQSSLESQQQVKSSPIVASSTSISEDVFMMDSSDQNYQAYENLLKGIVESHVTHKDLAAVYKYVEVVDETQGKVKETELRQVLCIALAGAFYKEKNIVLERENEDETTDTLVDVSLNFLNKQQQRLIIENEKGFDRFLHKMCTDVLREYYERTAEQDRSRTVSSELHDRMVPVNYLISKTKLSHDCDVRKFVLQAEQVSKWFTTVHTSENNEDYIDAPAYEDAPYFCVVQSSGMGKTKIIYEGCKRLQKDKGWSCFIVLPSALKDSKTLTDGEVFSHRLRLEASKKANTAMDATTAALEKLTTFYEGLVEASNLGDNEKPVFLCFDEAQVYLKSQSFEGAEHSAFLFRCIRLWLRKKGRQHKVIGCFSGTIATLASFRLEADPELPDLSSREFTPKRYSFYRKGRHVFPVFLQTTTIGCLVGRSVAGDKNTTEYHQAIAYGRPLFKLMQEHGHLAGNEGTILRRMLLYGLGNNWTSGNESLKSCLSILGTRVQMGQTSFPITSEMVGYGYANLTYATSTDAMMCYMPDPVCGRLAMRMMDPNGLLGEILGRDTPWWLCQMKKIFSQGICRPEKGDFGEVMVALYFLFCADMLRRQHNDRYHTFSVSLEDWIEILTSGGLESTKGHPSKLKKDTLPADDVLPTRKSKRLLAKSQTSKNTEADQTMEGGYEVKATVSFIQVCRSYLRSYGVDWEGLCSQEFLSYMYASGTAFYVYPGCPIIDLVTPIKLSGGRGKDYFAPMVISIKSHSYYAPAYARWECNRMKEGFKNVQEGDGKEGLEFFPGALCLLVVFGSTAVSDDNDLTLNTSLVPELAKKKVVSRVLRIPEEDAFGGFCDTFHTLTSETTRGSSELFASHSFVRAYCNDENTEELDGSVALRASAGSEETEFLQNLNEQFKGGHSPCRNQP